MKGEMLCLCAVVLAFIRIANASDGKNQGSCQEVDLLDTDAQKIMKAFGIGDYYIYPCDYCLNNVCSCNSSYISLPYEEWSTSTDNSSDAMINSCRIQ